MVSKTTHSNSAQIQIRFSTKQEQFAVPGYPLSVPATVKTNDLNILVHELLKESNELIQLVEFDFLINSEFLRTSLSEHITEKGISSEEVITVEYIEKHPPPEPEDCLIHDDWVSAVDTNENWILTGCYDNSVHIWTSKGKKILSLSGHSGPIKGVAWISLGDNNGVFVSVSQDQTAKIWNWNIVENSVQCLYTCKGHSRELEAVGVEKISNLMATGSWDKMLKIWSTSQEDDNEEGESAAKISKVDSSKVRIPVRTMKGHDGAITGVVWSDKSEIITSSWDHSLKLWDSELGGVKREIIGNKSFLHLDYSMQNKTIVTASTDKIIRLYDPRSTEGTIVKSSFVSHTEGVKCVYWSKTADFLFISGAYDSNMKLWDTRSPKAPLFDLSGHDDKVLCCDWSNPKLIISGGADNTVRIFKSKYAINRK